MSCLIGLWQSINIRELPLKYLPYQWGIEAHADENNLENIWTWRSSLLVQVGISLRLVLIGFEVGILNGYMIYAYDELKASETETDMIVALPYFLSMLGIFTGIWTINKFRRWKVILIAGMAPFMGWLLMGSTSGYGFILGSAISSFGIGLAVISSPICMIEVARSRCRNIVSRLAEVLVLSGTILGCWASYNFILKHKLHADRNFQSVLIYGEISSLLLASISFFLPEMAAAGPLLRGWRKFFADKTESVASPRRFGIVISILQPLTGIEAITIYSSWVLARAKFGSGTSMLITIRIVAIRILFNLISQALVKIIKPRRLLISCQIGMLLTLIFLGIMIDFIGDEEDEKWNNICIGAIYAFAALYSLSMGSTVSAFSFGQLPENWQAIGVSLGVGLNWFFTGFTVFFFLPSSYFLTVGGAIFFFAAFVFLALVSSITMLNDERNCPH